MNYTTAIFLVNKRVRAVVGIYEDDQDGKLKVTRTLFKTLDPDIKVGDFVLVPTETRHKMTVNKIVEVDAEVDFDSRTAMSWVIGVVDKTTYDEVVAMEASAIVQIKSAEKRKKQDELRAALLKDNEFLKDLPIAQLGDDTPKPRVPGT